MENFVVSARKYRPQTFDTVVGQSAITGTLRNAIENNHLAQAFLFCGPRGVGKTSCARILAREINMHAAKEKGEATDVDFSLNIFELDAASNNSVDDIRNLTDQVRFAPQVGTYKVYIIDEVHMLSQQAFNAFLKTLEEPPAHAIFILATTEKHKILPTILSRCQIFDFQRITVNDIAQHLQGIAEKEGVEASPEGLNIIAEKADGAMRDALSMFDQLVSFSGNNLTYESVIENLNVLDYDYYFRMVSHVIDHKIPDSLLVFDEILNKGFDGHNFIVGLAQHLRNLMVCKNPNTAHLIETSDAIRDRYLEQSKNATIRFIFKALEVLNDADVQYKSSKNQRLLVELALMRLCAIPSEKKSSNNSEEKPANTTRVKQTPAESSSAPNTPAPAPEVKKETEPEISTGKDTGPESPQKERATPEVTQEPVSKLEDSAEKVVEEAIPTDNSAPTEPESSNPVPEKTEATVSDAAPEQRQPDSAVSPEKQARRKKYVSKFQTASVSISAGLREDDQAGYGEDAGDEADQAPVHRPYEDFTEEQLIDVWKAYAQQIRENGRESLYSTLNLRNPQILENNELKLVINNSAQELELNREKGELLDFLREKLNNYSIEVNFVIERDDQPTGLYTNSQKFEAMVKKNPNLGKLSGNLNLDIY